MSSLLMLAIAAQAMGAVGPGSYTFSGTATPEGAKAVVIRLIAAAATGTDTEYDVIAKGMVFMAAPDFALPLDRAEFKKILSVCSAPAVISSRAFPKMPQAQAVRISMNCAAKEGGARVDFVADVMADDAHVFAMLPGGVERVWPERAVK